MCGAVSRASRSMKQLLYKRIFYQIFRLENLMPWRVTSVRREKLCQFFLLRTEVGTAVGVGGPNPLHGSRKGIFLLPPAAASPPYRSALVLAWLGRTQVDTEPDKNPSLPTFSAVWHCAGLLSPKGSFSHGF